MPGWSSIAFTLPIHFWNSASAWYTSFAHHLSVGVLPPPLSYTPPPGLAPPRSARMRRCALQPALRVRWGVHTRTGPEGTRGRGPGQPRASRSRSTRAAWPSAAPSAAPVRAFMCARAFVCGWEHACERAWCVRACLPILQNHFQPSRRPRRVPVCIRVCARVYVRACACVRACARARACVHLCACARACSHTTLRPC